MMGAAAIRPLLRIPRVASDAADVLLFRSKLVKPATPGSDTFLAALGLFGVATALALASDKLPSYMAVIVAAVCTWLAFKWARLGTKAAHQCYLVVAAGAFIQLLAAVAPKYELAFSAWFVIAFMFAMRRTEA